MASRAMFLLSKLVGLLTDPTFIVLVLLTLGVAMTFSRRRRRAGQRVLGWTLGIVLFLSIVPLDVWLTTRLENRFPRPAELPDKVDGIIILGGAVNPAVSAARGMPTVNNAATRLTALIPLAARHPDARIVFTGGAGNPFDQEKKEADYATDFYREIGFDPRRVVFERESRNTRENADLSKALMRPGEGETWLLITSAGHMPRAVGCFRAAGWPVVAYPVDYTTTGLDAPWWTELRFSPTRGFVGLNTLVHEWVGLLSYRLAGWTDELYPGP